MNLSDAGLNLIKQSEGFRRHVYNDVVGKPTIGYGHLIKPGENLVDITDDEATGLLRNDVAWAEQAVTRFVQVPLTQSQFDALVDFTFNLGAGALEGSTLLKVLNGGDYEAAGNEFLKWTHAGGKIQPGLVTRRQAELDLWNS
jgi:lysozyme